MTGISEGERGKRAENLFEEIAENSLNLGEGSRNPDPGSTQNPQQNQPKKVQTKTHCN